MNKYRSKVVEIEAIRFSRENEEELRNLSENLAVTNCENGCGFVGTVYTLEGDMQANEGDWIIRGLEGEFYPCKDSVFQIKYERAI